MHSTKAYDLTHEYFKEWLRLEKSQEEVSTDLANMGGTIEEHDAGRQACVDLHRSNANSQKKIIERAWNAVCDCPEVKDWKKVDIAIEMDDHWTRWFRLAPFKFRLSEFKGKELHLFLRHSSGRYDVSDSEPASRLHTPGVHFATPANVTRAGSPILSLAKGRVTLTQRQALVYGV